MSVLKPTTLLLVVLLIPLFLATKVLTSQLTPAAIVSNGLECSKIGMDVLNRNGSAADAAVAVMLCESVACSQSTGLGGGFVMTIYTRATRKAETLIAREPAPAAANETMFNGLNATVSQVGGLSIAVPSELAGLWELHRKYGVLKWADLVEPSIKLCEDGHSMSKSLHRMISQRIGKVQNEPSLSKDFLDPVTRLPFPVGHKVKRPQLARTLKVIARDGASAFYDGELTKLLLEDIQENGGIITAQDLKEYKPVWGEAETASLKDGTILFTTPAPTSGPLLTFIMNIMNGYDSLDYSALTYHRFMESLKFAFAKRTDLGDPEHVDIKSLLSNLRDVEYANKIRGMIDDNRTSADPKHYGAKYFSQEDHGTAHVSIVAPNGDAVAITGTINYVFGSFVVSKQTGIVLNDEMDDFSVPGRKNGEAVEPSPANFIRPGKISASSMCPSILVNKNGDVELAIGAAGGTKILSSVSHMILRQMFFNESLYDAILAPRIHHQLLPMIVQYEERFDENVLTGLRERGHELKEIRPEVGFGSAMAISFRGGELEAHYDSRRGGSTSSRWFAKENNSSGLVLLACPNLLIGTVSVFILIFGYY